MREFSGGAEATLALHAASTHNVAILKVFVYFRVEILRHSPDRVEVFQTALVVDMSLDINLQELSDQAGLLCRCEIFRPNRGVYVLALRITSLFDSQEFLHFGFVQRLISIDLGTEFSNLWLLPLVLLYGVLTALETCLPLLSVSLDRYFASVYLGCRPWRDLRFVYNRL